MRHRQMYLTVLRQWQNLSFFVSQLILDWGTEFRLHYLTLQFFDLCSSLCQTTHPHNRLFHAYILLNFLPWYRSMQCLQASPSSAAANSRCRKWKITTKLPTFMLSSPVKYLLDLHLNIFPGAFCLTDFIIICNNSSSKLVLWI